MNGVKKREKMLKRQIDADAQAVPLG